MSPGCRFPSTAVTVPPSAAPIGAIAPVRRLMMGCSTAPTGIPATLIWLVSTTGAGLPGVPMKPPMEPAIVTGAFTSGIVVTPRLTLMSASMLTLTATS